MTLDEATQPSTGRAATSYFGPIARLLLCCCCWWCASPAPLVSAQTTLFPEKVEVKPKTQDLPDALKVWGGIIGGLKGNVPIVNPDGTISASTAIGDGTITFAKWAPNGCTSQNIPQWNGKAWVCSSITGAGGLDPAADATITGAWRFSRNTVIGDATTPQQLLHVYKSGSSAALRIEQGGAGGSWWDFTAAGANLAIGTTGGPPQLTLNTTGLGIGKTPTARLDVAGDAIVTGLAVNGRLKSHLIPDLPDTYEIGSPDRPWKQSWLGQINAVIFAQQTATLLGGYTIIAKDAGTFAEPVLPTDTTIDFGKQMTPGHFVLVRAHDASGTIRSEYFQVGARQGVTTRYAVTRDLSGVSTPDPSWPDGTPFMVLGTTGDGRIELNAYNTPRIAFLSQGGTYNALTDLMRLGSLDGMPFMPVGKFGFYVGDMSTSGMSFFDSALTVRGEVRATSGFFGASATTGVAVDATGISVGSSGTIRSGTTTYAAGTGFFFGNDAGSVKARIGSTTNYVRWDGSSNLEVAGRVTATTGLIGGFTIASNALATNGKTAFNDGIVGVYLGDEGIGLGPYFQIRKDGWAWMSGAYIGNFTLSGGNLYTGSKSAWNDGQPGVHVGNFGISLGNLFSVDFNGNLVAANANIAGAITAGAGSTISGVYLLDGTVNGVKVQAGTIGAAQITAGSITSGQIAASTIVGGNISGNTITGGNIAGGTITGGNIAAGTISAGNLNVTQLSAITADMGSLTAGTITGATFKNTGNNLIINNNGMFLSGGPGSAGWIQWQSDGASIGMGGGTLNITGPNGGASDVRVAANGLFLSANTIYTQMNGGGNRHVCVNNGGALYAVCSTCNC